MEYVVSKNDNLYNIAKTMTKDPRNYLELAKINKLKNPDLIRVGDIIQIPEEMLKEEYRVKPRPQTFKPEETLQKELHADNYLQRERLGISDAIHNVEHTSNVRQDIDEIVDVLKSLSSTESGKKALRKSGTFMSSTMTPWWNVIKYYVDTSKYAIDDIKKRLKRK